jgi:hypothetical protein
MGIRYVFLRIVTATTNARAATVNSVAAPSSPAVAILVSNVLCGRW